MQGNPEVIAVLNDVLKAELTAINQYFLHAKMCEDWGYTKLAEHNRAESIDEMKHAEEMVDRILFLEGYPNLQSLFSLNIGETVPEQFAADLALEYQAVERLNNGIVVCRDAKDNTSREMLEEILAEEEDHVDWLESQLLLIEQVGVQNYLAEKI